MLVFKCYENNEHVFKVRNNCIDGISCPICEGIVGFTEVDKSVLDKIPYYEDLKQYRRKTGERFYYVTIPRECIIRQVLNILKERITRAEIALPLCKHTKRKHRLIKLLNAMKQLKQRYKAELKAVGNGWKCPNCSEGDYEDYFAGEAFKHRVCNACNILYDAQSINSTDLPK